ncbi:zinc ABC transporter substrate-binding protein [Gilliamella sp. Pas-s25]|uniref:zinc ABC transporter substrate-binding protein n=1 Tax=Gilliamella sp. Pas-s25 TaxID=2687310 RepID=UPI00135D177B|nr:zinc ABC transporter substrate-binding protein [Gilliamella sp. Pas-s25]MWP60935.1 zinc ABC transporter substrate-binding protein [Gilliamella sp. Pas-s25]
MNKCDIYKEMLDFALSYIRNVQSQNAIRKAKDISCFYEAELVHNIMISILETDFKEHDIWFLNNQAKFYYDNCNEDISPNYRGHIERIKKLFELVPYQLRNKLIWSGPQ